MCLDNDGEGELPAIFERWRCESPAPGSRGGKMEMAKVVTG